MEILTTIAEVRALLDPARAQGKTIGFMGTSGAMHDGHLSLVRRAVDENDVAIMFWGGRAAQNQSENPEDVPEALRHYTRDQDRDMALCEAAGMKYAFIPEDLGMTRRPVTVTLAPAMTTDCPRMEDPAHLDLVTTATARLYGIFGKVRYYSGEKDWQQLAIFKRMAEDLATEVEVIGCPVVREPDGLALSSRNVRLTAEERTRAPTLYAALIEGVVAIDGGERSAQAVEKLVRDRMETVGEAIYVNCVDAESLQPMDPLKGDVRIIASLRLGAVPLVDNVGVWAD